MHFDLEDIWVKKYLGIPYVNGARNMEEADCWGIVIQVWYNEFGIKLDGIEQYKYTGPQDCKKIAEKMDEVSNNEWNEIPISAATKGCALRINMRGQPMHCAVVVKPGVMLHTLEHIGSHLSDYGSFIWEKRIEKAYQHVSG